MNFEGKTIMYEASRIIGLSDADLEKLSKAKETAPVSEQLNVAPVMPEDATVQTTAATQGVAPEAVVQAVPNTAVNEAVVSDVVAAVKNEESTNMFDTPVQTVQTPTQTTVTTPLQEENNIFDTPMSQAAPIEINAQPNITVPNVEAPAVDITSNINNAVMQDQVNEPVLETPKEFYQNENVDNEENEIIYLDKIRNALISLKEENDRLKAENSELKNQIAVANQRVAIAEQQRAAQVTGTTVQMQTPTNISQTMTPTQAA